MTKMSRKETLIVAFGLAIGVTIVCMLMRSSLVQVAASSSEYPPEVQVSYDAWQVTVTANQLAEENMHSAIATWMETDVAECLAWKSLAYDKYNAGLELQTPIQEVERTLCLAPSAGL